MFSSGQLVGRPRVLSRYAACMKGGGGGGGEEKRTEREDVMMTSCSKLSHYDGCEIPRFTIIVDQEIFAVKIFSPVA